MSIQGKNYCPYREKSEPSITSDFCRTSVAQMPRTPTYRRYMGTLYFSTLEKRESWSEYMKDLKSRDVNDSTMKFFSAVKIYKCQPEICPV